jgi:photosystem II stability/assembly factor-like uncharacterized protein
VTGSQGWVVGESGTIRATSDGGATWRAQASGTTDTLYAVRFVDVSNGWAVGDNGRILHTTNGGASWQTQTSGTTDPLYSIACVDASTCWVVGGFPETDTDPPTQVLLKTTNGGQTWTRQNVFCGNNPSVPDNSACPDPLFAVVAIDAQTAWAVGDVGLILATRDGSRWQPQASPTNDVLNALAFPTREIGYIAGTRGTILKTESGGF